ncbi:hypothetical protein [Chlamydiifrater phoenicopteri]|uniref:hypothetical protein n=1 Tax=Chlamydiifrater phoenicopteri TaxID=2681469 RepID=UPI001BCC17C8|nr:hypothetical protein [Chlamydiifrater phoenicopteri]
MCCTDCISASTNCLLTITCSPFDRSHKKREAITLAASTLMSIIFLTSVSLISLAAAEIITLPSPFFGVQSSYLVIALLLASALISLSLAIACIKSWNKFSRTI